MASFVTKVTKCVKFDAQPARFVTLARLVTKYRKIFSFPCCVCAYSHVCVCLCARVFVHMCVYVRVCVDVHLSMVARMHTRVYCVYYPHISR